MTARETRSQPHFREAGPPDADLLLDLVREFTATQDYAFDPSATRRTLHDLLGTPGLGCVWLVEIDGAAIGYVALTFGFSIEYGGRDAFIDEIFVRASHRGRGLGRATLAFALAEAARLGIRAVHLEVEGENAAAERLYRSQGFAGQDRRLLTRRLVGPT